MICKVNNVNNNNNKIHNKIKICKITVLPIPFKFVNSKKKKVNNTEKFKESKD